MMLFSIALFDSLLLASIAQATPSVTHRDTPTYRYGGVSVSPPENVASVTGGVSIPTTLKGNLGDRVHFLTGFDAFNTADNCSSSFQLGIVGTIYSEINQTYNAVLLDPVHNMWVDVPEFRIVPGDYIIMTVTINPNDKTSGRGVISNYNTGRAQNVSFSTGPSPAVCSRSGGWYVRTQTNGDNIRFGVVEFLQTGVTTVDGGLYYPNDTSFAHTVNIADHNDTLYVFEVEGNIITAWSPPFL